MSLINQMLQELDARGTPAALSGVLQGQVRAVPQRSGMHPAWWAALTLAGLLCAGGLWLWLGRSAPEPAVPASSASSASAAPSVPPAPGVPPADSMLALSLKIDNDLAMPSEPAADITAAAPAAGMPAAADTVMATAAAPVQAPAPARNQGATPQLNAAPVADVQRAAGREPAVRLAVVSDPPVIAKQVRELTPRQVAENEYRKASGLIQQGRSAEAASALEQALQLDGRHTGARQTLAALLIESRRYDEAMRLLREGLQLDSSQSGLAMILARLQLDRGELKPALDTLKGSLPHAAENPDYQAFLAALLQRDGRHREAIEHYAQALRKSPENGLWWMGQGISLQAEKRLPEAIEAYKRARAGNGLTAELKAFVEDKLNSL